MKEESEDHSGHICPWWLAYTFDNPLRRLFQDPFKITGSYLRPGSRAADVGCGMGYFSVAMAGIVGPQGKVYAIDIQEKMLAITMGRIRKRGLSSRVVPLLCTGAGLNMPSNLDFVLIFWAAHEIPDHSRLFLEVGSSLCAGGGLLLAEPRFHVKERPFVESVAAARKAGFTVAGTPRIAFSRTAYLTRDDG